MALSAALKAWLVALVVLLTYSLVGAIVYSAIEDWTFLTSWYFTFTIISSVGYGCLGPSSYGSRVFTMFYVIMSVPIIVGALATVWKPVHEKSFGVLQRTLAKYIAFFRSDGDDKLHPVGPMKFYMRELMLLMGYAHMGTCLLTALLCWAMSQDDGAFANGLDSSPNLNLFDALYFTVITSSTVGFGDVCPNMDSARVFTIFAAGYGLSTLTFFVEKVGEAVGARALTVKRGAPPRSTPLHTLHTLSRNWLLLESRAMPTARLLRLESGNVDTLISKLDKDGDGQISRCEYLCGMLVALEKVSEEELAPLLKRFDDMDADRGGSLSRDELYRLVENRAAEVRKICEPGAAGVEAGMAGLVTVLSSTGGGGITAASAATTQAVVNGIAGV